jgi:hypothetical protein
MRVPTGRQTLNPDSYGILAAIRLPPSMLWA